MISERAFGCIDRDLVEIGPTQARKLRVEIGEQASLQQRIIGEIDARHDIAGTVGNLFCFCEKVIRPAVENQAAYHFQGYHLFGDKFGRVQMIERKLVRFLLRKKLNGKFPLGETARLDGFKHITAMKVRIGAGRS